MLGTAQVLLLAMMNKVALAGCLLQNLLSADASSTVQIADSCKCQRGVADACCTDMTHFVLDYAAFEKLAHPGYGVMNLQFRSEIHLCLLDMTSNDGGPVGLLLCLCLRMPNAA